MRVELLARAGLCKQLHEEITGYYGFMAEKTGTLWEFDDLRASCNHGFASHIGMSISAICWGSPKSIIPAVASWSNPRRRQTHVVQRRIPVNNSWLQVGMAAQG
jgi:hypothetical protein